MISGKRILVTGSTGLIGSHIVIKLLQNSHLLSLICRDVEAAKEELSCIFKWYNLSFDDYKSSISWFEGDILDLGVIEDAIEKADYVIHAAAFVSTRKSDRDNMLKINAEGTSNLVNVSKEKQIKKFIHLSSVATLGPNPDGLVDEDYFFKPDPSTTAYAISKYAAEQEVWRAIEEGLNAVILNPSFVIGPSLRKNSSAGIFYAVSDGLPAYVEGATGYVSAQDIASSCLLLLDSEISGERFILSSKNMSTIEFLEHVSKAFDKKIPKIKLSRIWFPLVILLSKFKSLITKSTIPLTNDGLIMAASKKYFDGQRIVQKLNGFSYSDINKNIEVTARIVLSSR
jgi:nucleoside-diphosphate-sugar epimerase